jgi:hypothetical protein
VFSFKIPHVNPAKKTLCALRKSLVENVWAFEKVKNLFHLPEIEPRLLGRKALYKKLNKRCLSSLTLLLIDYTAF